VRISLLTDEGHVSVEAWFGGVQMSGELKFTKVDQIGIVVRDFEKTSKFLTEKFGIGPFPSIEAEHGSAKLKIGLLHLGGVQIELIQVLEGESIHSRFLRERGEGLHHLGFFVKNLDEALKVMEERGVKVAEGGEILGVKYAYLDTEKEIGITLELIQT